MILHSTFTKDWVMSVNNDLALGRHVTQLKNLEKAIVAFHLLELLVISDIEFIFKGGTSLILLLQSVNRLSVDIDIAVEKPVNNLEGIFSSICSQSVLFTHYDTQERETDNLTDTKHYKFYYQSFVNVNEDSYILLDLYESENKYANVCDVELKSALLNTSGQNVYVRIPDVNSILGDKLTAFAPDTIGISLTAEPGHRPKRIEALKQLYDIGILFDYAESVSSINDTYRAIAQHEINRRKLDIAITDVLYDTKHYAYIIGLGGNIEISIYNAIIRGYKDFSKFVADLSFDENQAVLAAAKVAYLVEALLFDTMIFEKYHNDVDMLSWSITDKEYAILNNYKYSNPEAFFYWYKAFEMQNHGASTIT